MKSHFLKKLSHASWHSWLRSDDDWKCLLSELWVKLPESVLKKFSSKLQPLIVLPPAYFGRVVRIEKALIRGAYVLQLDERLLLRSKQEALGILAHELAHLCVEATDDVLKNDLRADKLAFEWGFSLEISAALKKDLELSHPRRSAIEKLIVAKN